MNLKSAANLIENEYNARKAQAETRYREALVKHADLYAAELAVRAAILDGKDKDVPRLQDRKYKLIYKLGYSVDDFYPLPLCKKCEDTGYYKGKFCECARKRAAKESVEFSARPFTFDDCDLSVFDGESKKTAEIAYKAMRIFCEKFPHTKNINLLLLGTVGTGKTFLASCIANEIEKRGYSSLFLTAFKFNDICLKYHTTFDASKADGLNAVIDADLLVIDDLGTESILKNVTLEYLYTVINERMNAGKHTIITTNLSPAQLEAKYGERIVSRLFTERVCLTVGLTGKDLRR